MVKMISINMKIGSMNVIFVAIYFYLIYRWQGNIQQQVLIYINAQRSFSKITPLVSTNEEGDNFT